MSYIVCVTLNPSSAEIPNRIELVFDEAPMGPPLEAAGATLPRLTCDLLCVIIAHDSYAASLDQIY